jgi:serine/threonine protein kinase
MQPPIPLGTMLQKRYRVTKILGQGGFGRTYLAQDTACFDEPCVLKEFTPNERGRDSLRKARELFQREAKALYEINHPQIPRFRANFEEAKRLFLVQEYAEGKTYAKILGERIRESRTFSEQEAISFLQNMLPVLENIHAQGIIHRDISPDNIIFRENDKLPVLIDFGVVKAGVQNLEAEGDIGQQGTTVGKAGYAPNEQLQTGEAYANSDLYALAVTTVVMMTGRKPESLIDKATMNWKWQQWLPNISPWFAKVLMRMMSYRPSNRYQSAREVAQALRSVADLVAGGSNPDLSDMGELSTVTSGGSHHNSPTGNRYTTYSPRRKERNPILNSPWILAVAGGLIVLVPFILIKSLWPSNVNLKPINTPVSIESTNPNTNPVATNSPVPATPASVPTTLVTSEVVVLPPGQVAVKQGTLQAGQTMSYRLMGMQQNQVIMTSIEGGSQLSVLAANGQQVDFQSKKVGQWQGNIPVSGEYVIEVTLPEGLANNTFKLNISSPQQAGNPSPTPLATVSPTNAVPTVMPVSPKNLPK